MLLLEIALSLVKLLLTGLEFALYLLELIISLSYLLL